MSFTRKDEESKELSVCKSRATLFNKIAFQQCRTTPGHNSFTLSPIHWEKGSGGAGAYAARPPAGVYEAKGSGAMFRPLHSEEACRKASQDAINEWTKCVELLPESSPKPK